MAWGYWTTYSATSQSIHSRSNHHAPLSPPFKREHSLERESRAEKERLLKSNSSGSLHDAVDGPLTRGTEIPQQANHIAPDKVAYERHLLLGDPDWSNRTIADRNTLPRKKPFDQYDRGSISPPEEVYYSSQKSAMTPPGSGASRKSSDDVFCPACAHQSSQQNSSNRESRVSFGSVASSSRGSSGFHQSGVDVKRGIPPRRSISVKVRSRSQEDDESSGHGGGMASSSVPTPPPPPFLSQRDLVQSSLLETINQKMSILSSIRNAIPAPNPYPLPSSTSYHHTPLPSRPQTAPRRYSTGKHLHQKNVIPEQSINVNSNGRKTSSTSLKEPFQPAGSTVVPCHPPRSSRSSSRTTPRGSTSHASHESIKSSSGTGLTSTSGVPRTPSEDKIEVLESTTEGVAHIKVKVEEDRENTEGGSIIGIRRNSVSDRSTSRSRSRTPDIDDDNESADDEAQQTGTVRRKRRKSHSKSSQEKLELDQQRLVRGSQDRRLHVQDRGNCSRIPPNSCNECSGHRHPGRPLSRSEENLEERNRNSSVQFTIGEPQKSSIIFNDTRNLPLTKSQEEILLHHRQVMAQRYQDSHQGRPSHLSYSQEKLDSIGSRQMTSISTFGKTLPRLPIRQYDVSFSTGIAPEDANQLFHHRKHSLQQPQQPPPPQFRQPPLPLLPHQQPPPPHNSIVRPKSFNDTVAISNSIRPRSASIGDRLSEINEAEMSSEDRRHNTLDGHRRGILSSADRRLASMTSFQSTLPSSSMSATSSRSGKSSSRSSKSPSMENVKTGCNSSKCRTRHQIK